MTDHAAGSETELADILARCSAAAQSVAVRGGGSKRGVGGHGATDHGIDVSAMSGVTFYEANELVLSAKAGTPLSDIEALLAAKGQILAFEPMDCGPLFGEAAGRGTLGGALAANLSGPRRVKAGAVRDYALGVRGVTGDGRRFKSGGRVVKNVTGYDLPRGLAGSWGTLAVLAEVTVKVLPAPQSGTTLVLHGLSDNEAVAFLCAAMGSPWEVSGAAHLPAKACAGLPPGAGTAADAATLLRLEGFEPSVAYRLRKLTEMLPPGMRSVSAEGPASAELWAYVRDVRCFASPVRSIGRGRSDSASRPGEGLLQSMTGTPSRRVAPTSPSQGEEEAADPAAHVPDRQRPLWRVSVAPADGPALVASLGGQDIRHAYDWSGGLVWIEQPDGVSAEDALAVRIAAQRLGGHAMLMRGAGQLGIPAFQPQPPALAALARRLKASFDPAGILDPARMT